MGARENFLGLALLVGTAVPCDGGSRALAEEASAFVLKAGLGHPGGFAAGVSAEHAGLSAEILFTRGVVQRVETTLTFSVLERNPGFFRPRIALGASYGFGVGSVRQLLEPDVGVVASATLSLGSLSVECRYRRGLLRYGWHRLPASALGSSSLTFLAGIRLR